MRRTFFIVFFIFTHSLYSQVALGAKAGYNYAWLSPLGELDKKYDVIHGFYAGGYAEFTLGDIFSLQPDILYSRQGSPFYSLDYVNIPLHAKVNLDKVSVSVGPQLGFLARQPQIQTKFSDTSFSVVFGASYWIKGRWQVDIEYSHGMSNVFESDDSIGFSKQNNYAHRVLSVGIAFLIIKDNRSKIDRLFNTEK